MAKRTKIANKTMACISRQMDKEEHELNKRGPGTCKTQKPGIAAETSGQVLKNSTLAPSGCWQSQVSKGCFLKFRWCFASGRNLCCVIHRTQVDVATVGIHTVLGNRKSQLMCVPEPLHCITLAQKNEAYKSNHIQQVTVTQSHKTLQCLVKQVG